jgi:hypothetical protein
MADDLHTSNISLISHAHGRQRRLERGIERRELQAAMRYGVKQAANPGPSGEPRWRFTHQVRTGQIAPFRSLAPVTLSLHFFPALHPFTSSLHFIPSLL